jgi:hypothetical protein
MINKIKYLIAVIFERFGYRIDSFAPKVDMDEAFHGIFKRCRPYTMTSVERMYSVYKSVEYVVKAGIPGDLVECGVWRGGLALLMAETLLHFGVTDRRIILYDTFEGMSEPTKEDFQTGHALVRYSNDDTHKRWVESQKGDSNSWCYASLEDVKSVLRQTRYPQELIQFEKGKVEDTIPTHISESIALLRLDTDWYESTLHELKHLYPRLAHGGVLLLDDYGYWQGSRTATDSYFAQLGKPILLTRVDGAGAVGIKPDA